MNERKYQMVFKRKCMAEDYIDHSPAGARSSADAVGILKIVAGQYADFRAEVLDAFSEGNVVVPRVRWDCSRHISEFDGAVEGRYILDKNRSGQ